MQARWGPFAAGSITLLLAASLLATLPAAAAPPQANSWETQEVEGPPVALGFLSAGFLVAGTGDGGATDGLGGAVGSAECAGESGDADLHLLTFPDGEGCVQSLDTGSALSQEGVLALATAEAGDRVLVALPASGSSPTLKAYDLQDGALVQSFAVRLPGTTLDLVTNDAGERTAATTQSGSTFRLHTLDGDGVRDDITLKGQPRSLAISENGRYVAVGGNFTDEDSAFGYLQLYDLARGSQANPVIDQELRQAQTGRVVAVGVSNDALVAAGTAGGRLLVYDRPSDEDAFPQEAELGTSGAQLQMSPDGDLVLAATEETLSAYAGFPETLDRVWSTTLNGTIDDLTLRGDYVFASSSELAAYDLEGHQLWTRDAAATQAFNATGLGLAQATATSTPSQDRATVSGFVLHAEAEIEQATSSPTIAPGDIGLVNVTVRNTGAALLNMSLDAQAPTQATLDPVPEAFTLRPGQTTSVSFTVTVDPGADAGQLTIPMDVESDPRINATGNLTFEIGTATDLRVRLQPGTQSDRAVVQGQNDTARFLVENKGNTETKVGLTVLQFPSDGPNWPAGLNPGQELTVPARSVTTVTLHINVPEDTANGTLNRVILRGNTDAGAAAARVSYTVNPFTALELTPGITTKKLAPGGETTYTFHLTNLGSVTTNATVTAQPVTANGTAYVPAGWSAVARPGSVSLDPGMEQEITVTVAGPPAGVTGDRLRVQLQVQGDQGAGTSSVLFAVIDEALAEQIDEPTREQPIGLLAPLAGLGLAAAARRRWSA